MKKEGSAVSRTSLKTLRAIPTTCEQCPAGCGLIAYLDGERLVQILGNPNHPNNQGGICAKGIAGLNLVNDPERLLYPLKRIGPRGSGQWTKITWDEVYSTLSRHIEQMMLKGSLNEFVIDKGQEDPLLERFITALGAPPVLDRISLKNLNRDTAFALMVESPYLIEDVGNSRTILNFGANPYANHDHFIGFARRLVRSRVEKGARLITFDVRMSETAAKSDAWYPLKAGTDGLVALSMAKVIVEKGLADKEFMEKNTNSPLSIIKDHLSQYTPQKAAKVSGVRAADIERLAVEFATQKPSVALIGGGVTDHIQGSQNARCIALLNWLIGNLEQEGGLFFPRSIDKSQPKALLQQSSVLDSGLIKTTLELQKPENRINTYFAYLSNPAYDDPDCQSTEQFLKDEKKVPFLVVMDTHLTESASLADMVLPAATYLEGWGIKCVSSLDRVPILNLRQPVVSLLSTAEVLRLPVFEVGKLVEPVFRPKGEAKEIGNFCLELARRIGGQVSKNLSFKDTQDYIAQEISTFSALKRQGGLKLLKKQGLWKNPQKNKLLQAEKASPLRKQKVKIYSEAWRQKGLSPWPDHHPLPWPEEKRKDEFILTTFKSSLSSKGTSNSKWAREILHENRLWMNREIARELGIQNGDKVQVTSSVGTLIIRVLTTSRIHPQSLAIAEGFGHTATGKIAKAERFSSPDQDTHLLWWHNEGPGVNPNEIIERKTDPIGGGLGSKDTLVRLKKL
jgi:anaerobic selenocysteine-containing dehydrogenase